VYIILWYRGLQLDGVVGYLAPGVLRMQQPSVGICMCVLDPNGGLSAMICYY